MTLVRKLNIRIKPGQQATITVYGVNSEELLPITKKGGLAMVQLRGEPHQQ